MLIRKFTTTPPSLDMPIVTDVRLAGIALAASTATEEAVFVAHANVTVQAVKIALDAAVAGVANGATLYVNQYRAGAKQGADGAVATFALTSGATTLAAFTSKDLGATKIALQAGDVLTVKYSQGSTGLALPAGTVTISYSL